MVARLEDARDRRRRALELRVQRGRYTVRILAPPAAAGVAWKNAVAAMVRLISNTAAIAPPCTLPVKLMQSSPKCAPQIIRLQSALYVPELEDER